MLPSSREPQQDQAPLEGELLSHNHPDLPPWGGRLSRALRLFWFTSLAVTAWLLWLTLRGGPSGVLDLLLALLLATPLVVLTLVMLALGQLVSLLRRSSSELDAHLRAGMQGRDPRLAAMELRYTMAELRGQAGGLVFLRFMLTPGFLAAVGLSVLATLVMIPVALFTLLLNLF